MTGVRGDLLSVVAVLAVPLGLAVTFPREAIGFSASGAVRRTGDQQLAFVFLDSDAVAKAMQSTRILSKREERGGTVGADLLSADLPGTETTPVMSIDSRDRTAAPTVVESGVPPFLPSRRAAAPVRISAEAEKDDPPFPRNELLKLN